MCVLRSNFNQRTIKEVRLVESTDVYRQLPISQPNYQPTPEEPFRDTQRIISC